MIDIYETLKRMIEPTGAPTGPILVVLGEREPYLLVSTLTDGIHPPFVPTAAGIALVMQDAEGTFYRDLCAALHKTLAEECLNEIAAEEKQSVERGTSVYDPERHPAMGLEEFEQALGRRQRGPSSEGTPPAEAEGEG